MKFLAAFLFPLFCFGGSVTLTWDPNPEDDIAGYRIYYGPSSGTYTNTIDVGNVTTNTVHNLKAGTNFFAVTAYNTAGLESDFSNEISYTVKVSAPKNLKAVVVDLQWQTRTNKTQITPVAVIQTVPGATINATISGPWLPVNRNAIANSNGLASIIGRVTTNTTYEIVVNTLKATIPLTETYSHTY